MQKIIKRAATAITMSHAIVDAVGMLDGGGTTGGRATRGRSVSKLPVASDQRPMNALGSTARYSMRRTLAAPAFASDGPSFMKDSNTLLRRRDVQTGAPNDLGRGL